MDNLNQIIKHIKETINQELPQPTMTKKGIIGVYRGDLMVCAKSILPYLEELNELKNNKR